MSVRTTPVERLAAEGARAGVVLVGDGPGTAPALRPWAGRLADAGYTVAIPDLGWRGLTDPEDPLADGEALLDVAAARATLPATRPVFVVGFGLGGLYARLAACTTVGLAGVVEFYGRIVYPRVTPRRPAQPLDFLPGLACPIQCHYGTDDAHCPPPHVDELERRLAGRGQPYQVFRYPGCGHGFMDPGPAWRPDAAATAWGRTMNFLEQLASAEPGR